MQGRQNATPRYQSFLVLAVLFGVMTACLGMMFFGMAGVAMRAVGVMRRFLVIAGFMVFGGFAVMFCRVFVVLGGLVMVLDACVVAHVFAPSPVIKSA